VNRNRNLLESNVNDTKIVRGHVVGAGNMKTKTFHSPAKYDHIYTPGGVRIWPYLHTRWSPSSPSLLKEAEDSFLKPLNLQSEGEDKDQCHETWNFVIACQTITSSKKQSCSKPLWSLQVRFIHNTHCLSEVSMWGVNKGSVSRVRYVEKCRIRICNLHQKCKIGLGSASEWKVGSGSVSKD
jgi:hypothetical protein